MALTIPGPVMPSQNTLSHSGSPVQPSNKQSSQAEQELHVRWEEIMQHKPKFVHYDKVAVLMLSWDDTCNDLQTKKKVEQLSKIFKELYGFKVRNKKLSNKIRAQLQIVQHLVNFLSDFEDERSSVLLIIYYAGHGWAHRSDDAEQHETQLRLVGQTTQEQKPKEKFRNTIMWDEAEKNIANAEADVLLIFDCCHAGLLGRSHATKRFESLAACTAEMTTRPPGDDSFTTALCWALEKLQKLHSQERSFFTTSELRRTIMEHQNFPKRQIPQLTERMPSSSHIVIAPYGTKPPAIPAEEREDPNRAEKASYIDLRFHFDDCNNEKIYDVARCLKDMVQDRQLLSHRIDLLGKDSVWKSTRWRNVADLGAFWYQKSQKRRKLSQVGAQNPQMSASTLPVSPAISVPLSEDHPEDSSEAHSEDSSAE
ncbi:hypothetical protein EV356DRAFT_565642 [Viridothelium virens]|uniref:Peptidase C14 caspase domain-containing protein n=1 Tax=Viridothelium virens TaxID=1048519 RepID=A0A6A6HEC5_VIRVR|nr:hypothetical protein EV356DRAFT_565642 [Viridothelium virens]